MKLDGSGFPLWRGADNDSKHNSCVDITINMIKHILLLLIMIKITIIVRTIIIIIIVMNILGALRLPAGSRAEYKYVVLKALLRIKQYMCNITHFKQYIYIYIYINNT